jgi:hypothetical protein
MFWDDLKKELTGKTTPGTVGYREGVVKASEIFIIALPYLKNSKLQLKEFNQDSEIKDAISTISHLKQCGVL